MHSRQTISRFPFLLIKIISNRNRKGILYICFLFLRTRFKIWWMQH